jgi:putative nucleotidyltransferase with HDIG domain
MNGPASFEDGLAGAAVVRAAREALAGYEGDVWIVGGAVRDAALGREISDLDLAVTPGEEKRVAGRIAKAAKAHIFRLSDRFPTWRATARDGAWHVDVSATRGETVEQDLAERDFSVNAIAVPLEGGEPVDPHGGLGDLDARVLRAVSDHAFSDDPLRLLRAARFGAGLGIAPEPATLDLARAAAPQASEPAGERTFAELRGILAGPDPLRGIELVDELGITGVVLPEVEELRGVAQNPNHHLDVLGHTLEVMRELLLVEEDLERFAGERAADLRAYLDEPLADELTRGGAMRFAALFHDIGKPATRGEHEGYITFIGHDSVGAEVIAGICKRLRTSNKFSSYLQDITRHHLRLGFLTHSMPLDRGEIYDYLAATEPVSADVTLLTVADRLSARGSGPIAAPEMVQKHLDLAREMIAAALDWHAEPPSSPIRGEDLAAELGVAAGPWVGDVLGKLRRAAYTGEAPDRESAVALARELKR